MAEGPKSGGTDPDRALLALLFFLALAAVGWFVVRRISDNSKLQDCVMAGRRNCAPVEAVGR